MIDDRYMALMNAQYIVAGLNQLSARIEIENYIADRLLNWSAAAVDAAVEAERAKNQKAEWVDKPTHEPTVEEDKS